MTVYLTPPTPLWARAQQPLADTHAMATSRSWLASEAWGLLLLGGVGRGKSQAAAWLWHRLRDEAFAQASKPSGVHTESGRPIYQRAGETFWLRARELQRLSWDDRADVLRRCAGAYGLIVDEMGGEDERTGQALGDVLEQRGDEKRRTVMTTNLDGPGFLERYGDRLTSRLRSGGVDGNRARWAVVVQGPDLRGSDTVAPGATPLATEAPILSEERRAAILAEEAARGNEVAIGPVGKIIGTVAHERRTDEARRAAGGSEG